MACCLTESQVMELAIIARQATQQLRDDAAAWRQIDRITRSTTPGVGEQTCNRIADRLDAAVEPLVRKEAA